MAIGTILREEREKQGKSLEEIEVATKIQKRYLLAVERENFSVLPGKFYARAFIKEYAQALNMDAGLLVEANKDDIPTLDTHEKAQYSRIHRSRKESAPSRPSEFFSFLPTVIVILLIVGIILLAWYFYGQTTIDNDGEDVLDNPNNNEIIVDKPSDQDVERENEEDSRDEEANIDEEQDVIAESTLEIKEKGDESSASPKSTYVLTNPEDELTLTVSSDGKTYLGIEDGNGEVYFATALTEEISPKEFDMSDVKQIHLNIGRTTDFSATINGVELELPNFETTKVHQHIWINIGDNQEENND